MLLCVSFLVLAGNRFWNFLIYLEYNTVVALCWFFGSGGKYRRIRGVSNMQSKQSQENLMLRRTSLVGLSHIPTLLSALNSTILFLF